MLSLIRSMTEEEEVAYHKRTALMIKRAGIISNVVSSSWIRRHTNIRPATNVVAYVTRDSNAPKIFYWYRHVERK